MITVSATSSTGEKFTLTKRTREPVYVVKSHEGGRILFSHHLSSLQESMPFDVLLDLSVQITKLERELYPEAPRPLVSCAACREPYDRADFELLVELEDHPNSPRISVRSCGRCGGCVAAPRA